MCLAHGYNVANTYALDILEACHWHWHLPLRNDFTFGHSVTKGIWLFSGCPLGEYICMWSNDLQNAPARRTHAYHRSGSGLYMWFCDWLGFYRRPVNRVSWDTHWLRYLVGPTSGAFCWLVVSLVHWKYIQISKLNFNFVMTLVVNIIHMVSNAPNRSDFR